MVDKFWCVLKVGSFGCQYRHPSLESAKLEAERLAKLHPGSEFVVLEGVAAVRCEVRPQEWDTKLTTRMEKAQAEVDASRKSFYFETSAQAVEAFPCIVGASLLGATNLSGERIFTTTVGVSPRIIYPF